MMDDNGAQRRNLVADAKADIAEAAELATTFDESTGFTWLWSILFGPLYFWVHGFVGRGFILLGISIVTLGLGVLVAPFLAYPAWKKKARIKAENLTAISRARRG
jgi:hypothetical protein